MTTLVTGAAGFIGYHVAARLLADGAEVVGLDNLNDYYDVRLKEARVARLQESPGFTFAHLDLADRSSVAERFRRDAPEVVVHLAAQAGVRWSLEHPEQYVDSNLVGFANVLEGCRRAGTGHLVYASSSSVYGANSRVPFSVHQNADHAVSLYAATKKANEGMAHAYSHLFGLPATGLRFFTVYGPWGRPDMAYFSFTRAILEGRPIDVFNHGRMQRDFTYVDDVVEGTVRIARRPAAPDPDWSSDAPDASTSRAPWRLYNIGNHQPVELLRFIEILEDCLGRKAEKRFLPMQPGDVVATCADTEDLRRDVGFYPATSLEDGLPRFVAWYRSYYGA